jgi:uncharacterized protein YbjT (DUF2867 family)
VLGATGNVGSKISETLLNDGHNVKLVARTPDKLKKFRDRGAEVTVADIFAVDVVANVLKNADGAFVLLPPNFTSINAREYQRKIGNAIIAAIKQSGIKYIVNLSSCGAHVHEGNGIIAGVAEQEVKLNQLNDVNVLHLRPAYFMENFLMNVGLIKNMEINGSTAEASHKIPMTATKDIASVAAKLLVSQDFRGKIVKPILGDRDYSFKEFTHIIGNSIGKPDLEYVQFATNRVKQAMISQGISADVADEITSMEKSLKNGIMNYEKRTVENSSPTSAEIFAKEVFAPLYNA